MKKHPHGALLTYKECQEALDRNGFVYTVCVPDGPGQVRKTCLLHAISFTARAWNLKGETPAPQFRDDYLFGSYWDAFAYSCKANAREGVKP